MADCARQGYKGYEKIPESRAGSKGVSTKGVSVKRSDFIVRAFYTVVSKRFL